MDRTTQAEDSSAQAAKPAGEPVAAPAASPTAPPSQDGEVISWSASEFIAHNKSTGWYGLLLVGALVLAAAVFLLTRDKISTAAVLVAALAFGYYAGRQPRQLQYELDRSGLSVGDKRYEYSQFRSFAIMDEGGHFASIAFMPLRRFGQLTTIYFDPDDEERIVQLLGDRLPLEPRDHDAVDKLMKRIRF